MDKLSFARGEEFKVKGTTSLPAGTVIYITLPSGLTTTTSITARVDAEGKFETEKLRVNPDAALSTYTVKAKYSDGVTVEDSVSIKVVRQSLDANIDKTIIAKGGKIKINGTTTVEKVYIYADESGVFDEVAKLKYEDKAFSYRKHQLRQPMFQTTNSKPQSRY
jgi:hypothetical protein